MKIKRLILLSLIIIWMIVVFLFSNQKSESSSKTSGKVSKSITKFYSSIVDINEYEKEMLIKKVETPIRKLAHFSIYTIGGILLISFFSTFEIKYRRKIILSILVGILYACTDEFHQLFIDGRSARIGDICIDTLGIVFGIIIVTICLKIKGKKNEESSVYSNS